jgi:small-conductance mechanosensitive channel
MRIATGLVRNYSQKAEGVLPSTSIFANLTKILILVIGVLILLQYLGISITPVLTALGVGGLAVALALQDTLSNIFAGIQILLSRQIKPGDYVRLDSGSEGYISDISWRNTSIRTAANNMVIIPNSKLSNTVTTNYELPEQEMAVPVNGVVSYSSDLDTVERIALEAGRDVMKEVPGGVAEFEPSIRFTSFSDFGIQFAVNLRAKSFQDQYLIRHEYIKRLHKRFAEQGIEIPFPMGAFQPHSCNKT